MNKKLVIQFVFGFFAVLATVGVIFAQENPEEVAKKYNVTFPISELGNCADFASCRTYCDDPVNSEACVSYAEKKGFYKQSEMETRREEMLQNAKGELGCTSEETCREICHQEENFDKCSSFAQKYGLPGGQTNNQGKPEVIQKAKEILGCDSEISCRAVCEQEANRDKCSQFAKQTGLRGGEQRVGPGGCNSEETCKAFCSDPNKFNECSKFGGPPGQGQGQQQQGFHGPGGCTSEESCRTYCETNPNECRQIGGRQNIQDGQQGERPSGMPNENRDTFCKEHPEQCKFNGNNRQEGQRPSDDFCKTNPERCNPNGQQGNFDPKNMNQNPEEFCKTNPEKCNNIQNMNRQGEFNRPPEGSGQFNGQPPMDEKQGEYRPPENMQPPAGEYGERPPEGTGSEGIPQTQQVQGEYTERSLIQKIFDFFLLR